MTDIKLKGKLPDGDANGLKGEVWRKALVREPLKPNVAIVVFDAPTATKNYETLVEIPSARVLAIEPITEPAESEMLIRMLRRKAEERTQDTPLDFPEPEAAEPLQLTERGDYVFVVRDGVAGRFTLVLQTATGAELAKRGNLIRSEHDDVPSGTYSLAQLGDSLRALAEKMLADVGDEPVVDAEIVDDEEGDQ